MFFNKLTLITRKAKILLLANANVFFSITFIARLVNLIKTATFQASSDVWHNRHRVWSTIQQVKKKDNHIIYIIFLAYLVTST